MVKKIILISLVFLLLIFTVFTIYFSSQHTPQMIYGVTFSWEYCQFLGLNYQDVLHTILDKWHFKHLRVSAQWNSVEPEQGKYDFTKLDWIMNEAAMRGAKVMLAIGQKTPRWPECHTPEWAKQLSDEDYKIALQNYVAQVVQHYANYTALEIWQVENEPFFSFGQCRKFTVPMLKEELQMVKKLDPKHLTLVSDSGELGLWFSTVRAADLFGTTMYRVVWNKYLGYWDYGWLPPSFYRFKLWLNVSGIDRAYITELQAEPWLAGNNFLIAPLDEQYKSMDLQQLQENVDYAARVGMPRAYLWGAEWWYWLDKQGQKEIPNFIQEMSK